VVGVGWWWWWWWGGEQLEEKEGEFVFVKGVNRADRRVAAQGILVLGAAADYASPQTRHVHNSE